MGAVGNNNQVSAATRQLQTMADQKYIVTLVSVYMYGLGFPGATWLVLGRELPH